MFFSSTPCFCTTVKEPVLPETPTDALQNSTSKKFKGGSYPFMSGFQKERFTTKDAFPKQERWKYEGPIMWACLVLFVVYWGFLREETHIDEMIKSPPYLRENALRLAIARLTAEGRDTRGLEAELEELLAEIDK